MRLRRPLLAISAALGATCFSACFASIDDSRVGATSPVGTDAAALDAKREDAFVPGTDAASCTASVQTNPHNCGACGHDCLQGACASGVCGAFTVKDKAGANLWGIGLANDLVFYTDDRGNDVTSPVVIVNRDGTASSSTLVGPSNNAPTGVTSDPTHLYIITAQDGQVHGVPLDGGSGQNSAYGPGFGANGVTSGCITATATSQQYFNSGKEVRTAAYGQIFKTVLTDPAGVYGAVASSDHVYYTNGNGEVRAAGLDGSNPTTISSGGMTPQCIVLDGTTLYWTDTGTGDIHRYDLVAQNPSVIASGETSPIGIAVDATSVWWVAKTRVRRIAK